MRLISLCLVLLSLGLLVPSGWATTHHKKGTHRKAVSLHKKAQIPFSFLPPYQPNQAIQHLQAPLTARLIDKHMAPSTYPTLSQTNRPRYTQIFLTSVQPVTVNLNRPVKPTHPGRFITFHWTITPKVQVDYPERSWVTDIDETQSVQLAENLTDYLAKEFSPSQTTLLLAIPDKTQARNAFTPILSDRLRKAGFALVDSYHQAPGATLLRYQVSRLDTGIWVKLQLQNRETNRFYALSPDNRLLATSPFSIRPLKP